MPRARAHREELEQLLEHRSPGVRSAAALALGSVPGAEDALIAALARERNDLVLVDECSALADLRCARALPELRRLALRHPSQLARTWAVDAVARIAGRKALSFLAELRAGEASRRVRTTIDGERAVLSAPGALADLLGHLSSRDYIVRIRVAGGITSAKMDEEQRDTISSAFRRALKHEPSKAVAAQLRRALADLK